MKHKRTMKVAGILLASALLLSLTAASVMAAGDDTNGKFFGGKFGMRGERGPGFGQGGGTFLKNLVDQGIITQEQSDKWQAFNQTKAEERKAEMEKLKAMTAEERKAYLEQNKANKPDMMAELVSAGIITQEQADKIAALKPQKVDGKLLEKGKAFCGMKGKGMPGGGTFLKNLVDQGIITQEQSDKWQAFNQTKAEERKAEMEKLKAMTAEERKAYLEQNKANKPDIMAELVSAGIITQEQADQIKALKPQVETGKQVPGGRGHGHRQAPSQNTDNGTNKSSGTAS